MILSLYWRVLIIKTENTTFNILTVLFQTFVYIILTDFNFTRKIVTFVYSILTDFNFTRKIVTFVWISLTDFNFTKKV